MNTRKFVSTARSIRSNSTDSSPRSSSSESDTDEDGNTSMADHNAPQGLTVAIPRSSFVQGPYCPRRPALSEILANTAPPPWTLSAFMAYLSQNHCLETLEFTMDASRYRKHYMKMSSRNPGAQISPSSEECSYVRMLWRRLMEAYIAPNGPREVNLPSDVRDSLLSLPNSYHPPHPSSLDTAVSKIYELMEESVLVPFLNSLCPQTAHPENSSGENFQTISRSGSYDDFSAQRHATSQYLHSTQQAQHPHIIASSSLPNAGGYHHRASAPSPPTSSLTRTFASSSHHRFHSGPPRITPSGFGTNSASGSEVFTDESGSTGSPGAMSEVLTPPTTPPMSDHAGGGYGGNTPSPRSSRGEPSSATSHTNKGTNQWKRVSSKLWKKRSSDIPDQEFNERTF